MYKQNYEIMRKKKNTTVYCDIIQMVFRNKNQLVYMENSIGQLIKILLVFIDCLNWPGWPL